MTKTQRRHVVRLLALALALTMILSLSAAQAAAKAKAQTKSLPKAPSPLASIQLYNPTSWMGQTSVEVPVGRLAAPGLIDWANVHLAIERKEVPFSIREGRVHWKARLTAPIRHPRAEDLLVFPVAVPQGQWLRVDVLPGKAAGAQSALKRVGGDCIVSYPKLKVTVNEGTGMLSGLESAGSALLDAPLGVDFYTVGAGTIERTGGVGPCFDPMIVKIKKGTRLAPASARLVSSASTPALTELNFVLKPVQGPALGVTYRIHASGCVEIWSDERPWRGKSPWIDFAVEHTLKLTGAHETLPYLQNRTEFYAFKDYTSVVDLAGTIHHAPKADVFEFGENMINGRRWVRQLYINPQADPAATKALAEMVYEGLIVNVEPVTALLGQDAVQVAGPEGSQAAAKILSEALKTAGLEAGSDVKATKVEGGDGASRVSFKLINWPEGDGLEGDGFSIRQGRGGKRLTIQSATTFGLMQGAYQAAAYLRRNPGARALPLIAGNPAVNLRCGGFGGGNHEVDFPYGTEAEWTEVFDQLIASGMNKMTSMGMWGNWKLPASYKYMPELHSTAPDAYDEVSGTRFVDFDMHREKSLRLIKYLHERGVKVWLWIPVGCVPTTFAQKYPEAMCTGSKKTPRFMHPKYRQYLDAYFKEILETYPLDGFMLVRDDNGGLDDSPEYKQYLATSRTKDPAWEQYLLIYDLLRKKGFKGSIMVYPYLDPYEPRMDPLVPRDFFIGGHGSGIAMLTRNYEVLGPMGDTWLDNLYTSFRVAPAPRMKRLLGDRGSYWIGGAYYGMELPWESVGYFGWEPTASVNTFRYDWGLRTFGSRAKAVEFASFSNAYEKLWEIYNVDLLPYTWQLQMTAAERTKTSATARHWLELYKTRLSQLQTISADDHKTTAATVDPNARWFAMVNLYGTFFEYSLRRAELHMRLFDLVTPHKTDVQAGKPLPADVRQHVVETYKALYASSDAFSKQTAATPGDMMRATEPTTRPYKEWVGGYNGWLEAKLDFKQFAGTMTIAPTQVAAAKPFELKVELCNTGVCPWIPGVGHKLLLEGDFKKLGLPEITDFTGEWLLPGEKRVITLAGKAPEGGGRTELKILLMAPFYYAQAIVDQKAPVAWK